MLFVAMAALLVIMEGMQTGPGSYHDERLYHDARGADDIDMQTGRYDKASLRRKAEATWHLAEFHYGRGEFDTAAREYQRLIDMSVYMEGRPAYSYRTDEAYERLRDIAQRKGAGIPSLRTSGQ